MQFAQTYEHVLNGTKTQTRRLVKPEDYHVFKSESGNVYNIEFVTRSCREKWRVNKTYAVQPGRGKKSVARIRMLSIKRHRLHEMSGDDIAAEGFPSLLSFKKTWNEIHYKNGNGWHTNPEVWVLEFEVID